MTTAILLTLAAAFFFGLSSVMEQRSTHAVAKRPPLSPMLLVDLAKRPQWVLAIGVNIVGSVLQVVALHFGELAVVQPLIVCNLLFAVLISVVAGHRQPDLVMVAGVICCAVGISCFIGVAHPTGGHKTVSESVALPLIIALAAVIACCVTAAHMGPRGIRPLWLALACGVDFGVTAFLLKLVPQTLPTGFSDPLKQWPLYMLVVVGPLGFLLNQNAFQAGTLIAPVLAIITTTDPLLSIIIGHWIFGEHIAGSQGEIAAELLSLLVMITGIVALAHRAPHVERQLKQPRQVAQHQ
jgi:drug/metabolite transporter (DMT)-like permease